MKVLPLSPLLMMRKSPPHYRKSRGRPVGKSDATQRSRRTAQETSDDKTRVVQMKLDAMKESETLNLTNKKSRRPPAVSFNSVSSASSNSLRDASSL